MVHIEIDKIYEREEVQRDTKGNPIKIPGKYEDDGRTPLLLKKKVVRVAKEVIKISNIKSFRPWKKDQQPQWGKIDGEVTVLYMEGDERRDNYGNMIHCTILIQEAYESFSGRVNAIRSSNNESERNLEHEESKDAATL